MGDERVRCRRACGAAAKGAGAAKSWLAAAGAATITESFEKATIAHKKLRSSDSEPPIFIRKLHIKLNACFELFGKIAWSDAREKTSLMHVLDCKDALGD